VRIRKLGIPKAGSVRIVIGRTDVFVAWDFRTPKNIKREKGGLHG